MKGRGQVVLCQSRIRREGIILDLDDLAAVRDLAREHAMDWHFHETRKELEPSEAYDSDLESSIILSLVMDAAAACRHAVPKREHQRALGLVARWSSNGSRSKVERKDLQGWWDCWRQAKASSSEVRVALLVGTFRSFCLGPNLIRKICGFVGEPEIAEVRVSICDDMGLAGKCRRFMRGDFNKLDAWTMERDYSIEARARLQCENVVREHKSLLQFWRRELWRNQAISDDLLKLWEDDLSDLSDPFLMARLCLQREKVTLIQELQALLNTRVHALSLVWRCRRCSVDYKDVEKILSTTNEQVVRWLQEKGVPLTVDLPIE